MAYSRIPKLNHPGFSARLLPRQQSHVFEVLHLVQPLEDRLTPKPVDTLQPRIGVRLNALLRRLLDRFTQLLVADDDAPLRIRDVLLEL